MKLFNSSKFEDVSLEFLEMHKPNLRPTTYANYLHLLLKRILPRIGDIKIRKITNKDLQNFVNDLISDGYHKHSAKDCMGVINLVLAYGVEMGYCKAFIPKIKYPREIKKEVNHAFTDSDYKKLLKFCMENPGKKTFPTLIAMTTGLRIGEACALRYRDVDFDEMTISVERSVKRVNIPNQKGFVEVSEPKTFNSIRKVPVLPEVIKLLKDNYIGNDVYISSGNSELPLEPRTYRQKYVRMLKKLDIEHHTFHDLRHTFASRCINAGGDARTVADILGHANVEMTLGTYTHITDERRRTVAAEAVDIL